MNWCDRGLFVSPIYYCLCTTERQFDAELGKLKLAKADRPKFVKNKWSDATTHFLECGGKLCAIVALGSQKGRSLEQIHALLVHEGMHIWQEIRDNVGEKEPSAEFEAYAVQKIAQELMTAYRDQTKGKKRGH